LTAGHDTYSTLFLKRMFNGRKVHHILPYDAPESNEEDQKKFLANRKRISISGVQEKYSLILDRNRLRLTNEKEQGNYILKPVPHGVIRSGMVPANEHLTMQIASRVYNIRTAANGMIFFKNGDPAYITKRFDVAEDGKKPGQEDFAVLAGKTEENAGSNYKYDFSYEGIAKLIRQYVAAWQIEMEEFFKLVIFNFLFSNGDAHLKNFSLLETINGDYLLSPAYDLLDTSIHVEEEGYFALDDLFDEWNWSGNRIKSPGNHPCKDDFYLFGKTAGLIETRIRKMLDPFLVEQEQVSELVNRSYLDQQTRLLYLQHYQKRLNMLNWTVTNT